MRGGPGKRGHKNETSLWDQTCLCHVPDRKVSASLKIITKESQREVKIFQFFFQTNHELAYAVIALMFFVRFQNIELSTLLAERKHW